MKSELIDLPMNISRNEIIQFFKNSADFSIHNLTETEIEFEKIGLIDSVTTQDQVVYKGKVTFEGDVQTKIYIKIDNFVLLLLSSLFSIFLLGLGIFLIISNILLGLVPIFFGIVIPIIVIVAYMNIESKIADVIINHLLQFRLFDENYLKGPQTIQCPICGIENSLIAKKCKNCSTEFQKCIICKKKMALVEAVFCPFCNACFHKIEFLEWLKTKAQCPNCKKEIDMWEFQKYLEQQEMLEQVTNKSDHKIEKLSFKICTSCNKQIPKDSIYCIFCGIRIIYDK